ncbi:Response regulator PleD [Pseudobythopirellula maris]|uniref:diguanylate cyclase n=1 Tax=Pseudobythopirellula maris TaxID=2527991 RepID=A0A5C5ZJC1_9BACT|nr:GGDEF domain-containing protein [Pseudobythopirellula maris]TWT87482.1 Response regulator PleD [Pseudobythopirellula maris]
MSDAINSFAECSAAPDDRSTILNPALLNDSLDDAPDCCLVQIYPADIIDGMRRVEGRSLIVGRDPRCDLTLDDSSVSRRHAEFARVDGGYEVRDLSSTNGTYVNGEAVKQRVLRSGDCVKLGGYLYKFLSAGSIETAYHETVYTALTIDALTGAFNKSYLLDNLDREIARSRRHGRPLALVMFDIDCFKEVNDTHGHLVGDEVLKDFGGRVREVCREIDMFARYGGEEFALLLSETPADEALAIAERCRQAIANEPFATAAGPLRVSCSFGLAVLDGVRSVKPIELIGEADERLYEAKSQGRNRVVGPRL